MAIISYRITVGLKEYIIHGSSKGSKSLRDVLLYVCTPLVSALLSYSWRV